MARKTLVDPTDPKAIRELIGKHYQSIMRTGPNLAQFQAQLHEEEMVQLLAGFAMDSSIAPSIRRSCALDVVTIARGAVKTWIHDGQTIDPQAVSSDGQTTIGQDIEQARAAAEVYQELNDLTMRGVHPSQWPEHVRLAAGNALMYFEETATAGEIEG